ncbi:MAG: citramalate synthase [Gammaproteobacteria bacterium]|nr:citramalate synthase [Gammaproteobacteria bacterium]
MLTPPSFAKNLADEATVDGSVELYDTTLRDGAQTHGIQFTAQDKIAIVSLLDEFALDYIELGWPGANPIDDEVFAFFATRPLQHAKLVAFGATCKPGQSPESSPLMQALVQSSVERVTLVAKTSRCHIEQVLECSLEDNYQAIYQSVKFLRAHGKQVWIDAEHFFDGYKEAPSVTAACLQAAVAAGAEGVALCDTNGGTLPEEIKTITRWVVDSFNLPVAIHAHNDCELAVANALAAVAVGAKVVQGCINGYGERCGNTNLTSLMGVLGFKTPYRFAARENLAHLTKLAHAIATRANSTLNGYAPFVGSSAFAHKAGLHASAVAKFSASYEHIQPSAVGNQRKILVSNQAGRSNLKFKLQQLALDNSDLTQALSLVKQQEAKGFQYEEADASLAVLMLRQREDYQPPFVIEELIENTVARRGQVNLHHVSLKVRTGANNSWVACEAQGPVEAIDRALRQALTSHWPLIETVELVDYKVRILNPESATAATTHVWIATRLGDQVWYTVGCSSSIFAASLQALCDAIEFCIARSEFSQWGSYFSSSKQRENKEKNHGHQAA